MPETYDSILRDSIERGLIEPEELHTLLQSAETARNIRILDASAVLPGSDVIPEQVFVKKHIAGAQFFDIEKIADHDTDLPHMLPKAEDFAKIVSDMGISNDDIIIIYGQNGLIMGPARGWWMFRVFGHEQVCVLNGGLPAWEKAGFAVNSAQPSQLPKASFHAALQPDFLKNAKDIEQTLPTKSALILDARPVGRFLGVEPEPRPNLESGHIPGSFNIPAGQLIESDTGKMKTPEKLAEIFKNHDISEDAPVITTCGSGITACVIALALFTIGKKNSSVYDGSWAEWGNTSIKRQIEK